MSWAMGRDLIEPRVSRVPDPSLLPTAYLRPWGTLSGSGVAGTSSHTAAPGWAPALMPMKRAAPVCVFASKDKSSHSSCVTWPYASRKMSVLPPPHWNKERAQGGGRALTSCQAQ